MSQSWQVQNGPGPYRRAVAAATGVYFAFRV